MNHLRGIWMILHSYPSAAVFHLNLCFSKQSLVWSLDSAIHQNYLTNSNKLKKKTERTWGKFVMPCNLLISNTSSFTTYREQWLLCSPQQNNSSQCPSYIFANLFAAWRIKVHPDLRIQWKTRLRRFPVCKYNSTSYGGGQNSCKQPLFQDLVQER